MKSLTTPPRPGEVLSKADCGQSQAPVTTSRTPIVVECSRPGSIATSWRCDLEQADSKSLAAPAREEDR